MTTLYEKLLEASRQKSSVQELRKAYEHYFEEHEQYKYLYKAFNGALQFVLYLENDYHSNYEPYLCKMNPLRHYSYKKSFVPKLHDLEGIVDITPCEKLRPFRQFPVYISAGGVPLLVGLPIGIVVSGMLSYVIHHQFTTRQMGVFNALKAQAFFVDAIYRFVTK